MKAKRQIISYQDMHIDVEKVTLLSTSEYIAWRDAILPIHECWWLRSRGISQVYAMDVWYDGSLSEHVVEDYNGCVRPALRILTKAFSNLDIGDKVELVGLMWTKIAANVLLCDKTVGRTCFRKDWKADDANDYKTSDIKKWLENWAKEVGLIEA